jgi:hypothetical protein
MCSLRLNRANHFDLKICTFSPHSHMYSTMNYSARYYICYFGDSANQLVPMSAAPSISAALEASCVGLAR